MVSGAPGTGKSTIARALGADLRFPVLSLNPVRGGAGGCPRAWRRGLVNRVGDAAAEVVFRLASAFPDAVAEGWWRGARRDRALAEFAGAIEVFCHCDPQLAGDRAIARIGHGRHPIHRDVINPAMADRVAELGSGDDAARAGRDPGQGGHGGNRGERPGRRSGQGGPGLTARSLGGEPAVSECIESGLGRHGQPPRRTTRHWRTRPPTAHAAAARAAAMLPPCRWAGGGGRLTECRLVWCTWSSTRPSLPGWRGSGPRRFLAGRSPTRSPIRLDVWPHGHYPAPSLSPASTHPPPPSRRPWAVLADPEGNEFCVLSPRGSRR